MNKGSARSVWAVLIGIVFSISLASCGGGGGGNDGAGAPPLPPGDRIEIIDRPPSSTTSKSATFTFRAPTSGSTVECALDDSAFTPCTSTVTYSNLAVGTHTFAVRALGASAWTTYTWEILRDGPPTSQGKGILYVPNAGRNSILVFHNASTASGDIAPTQTIVGLNTKLNKPTDVDVDMPRDRMYVANQSGNSVLVFDAASTASGNIAPTKVLPFSLPVSVAHDSTRDILYVAGRSRIAVYDQASAISETASPNRVIQGLSGITDLFIDSTNNRLYISQGIPFDTTVLVFEGSGAAAGNITPSRTLFLTTPLPFPSFAFGVAVDTVHDLLYLAAFHATLPIQIYADASTVTGNLAPTRTIGTQLNPSNSDEMLTMPSGLFMDEPSDRLYVANTNALAAGPKDFIWIFDAASTLQGERVPHRIISGLNTTFSFPGAGSMPVGIFVDTTR